MPDDPLNRRDTGTMAPEDEHDIYTGLRAPTGAPTQRAKRRGEKFKLSTNCQSDSLAIILNLTTQLGKFENYILKVLPVANEIINFSPYRIKQT